MSKFLENVSGLDATGLTNDIAVAWMNPTNADFRSVLILARENGPPGGTPTNGMTYSVGQSIGDGEVVYNASSSPGATVEWLHTGLGGDKSLQNRKVFVASR